MKYIVTGNIYNSVLSDMVKIDIFLEKPLTY